MPEQNIKAHFIEPMLLQRVEKLPGGALVRIHVDVEAAGTLRFQCEITTSVNPDLVALLAQRESV